MAWRVVAHHGRSSAHTAAVLHVGPGRFTGQHLDAFHRHAARELVLLALVRRSGPCSVRASVPSTCRPPMSRRNSPRATAPSRCRPSTRRVLAHVGPAPSPPWSVACSAACTGASGTTRSVPGTPTPTNIAVAVAIAIHALIVCLLAARGATPADCLAPSSPILTGRPDIPTSRIGARFDAMTNRDSLWIRAFHWCYTPAHEGVFRARSGPRRGWPPSSWCCCRHWRGCEPTG